MRLGVMVSGSGTLLDAMVASGLDVAAVLVDRRCPAEAVAERHGLTLRVIERTDFSADFDRVAYTEAVVAAWDELDLDLIAMAGWGTVLAAPAFDARPGRIINTHPALLPSFKGWHAVRAALDAGVKVTGCTVHVATVEVDEGPILAQVAVPVLPDDDEATLHERIKEAERRTYPEVLAEVLARGWVLGADEVGV
ncbi:MAG: phosphoribosylglycinamide formyltransferase [Microthrixaceae bacterium]